LRNLSAQLTLCADDYAMNRGVSEGILALAHHQRINAISCMVNQSDWKKYSKALIDLSDRCQIGCHLNFTQNKSLLQVIKHSYLKQWDVSLLEREIIAQLDAFEEGMQRPPDFIDGHQHVHQFPQIRDALLTVYKKRSMTAWLRTTTTRHFFPAISKRLMITFLGGARWKYTLQKQAIIHNSAFSGIYSFSKLVEYRRYFRLFLQELVGRGGVIMCHPGFASGDLSDTHALARVFEWQYFNSNEFLDDLIEYGLVL